MDFSNDDFLKPLLYRDIMAPENTPMGAAMGGMYGGMYPTNLLGGVTMPQGINQDTFQNFQKRQQKDLSFLKKAMLVLGGLVVLDLMKFKGLKGLFSKSGKGSLFSKFKNMFSRRTPTPTPTPTPKKSWWKRIFSRGSTP